jgi:hypothetical protein
MKKLVMLYIYSSHSILQKKNKNRVHQSSEKRLICSKMDQWSLLMFDIVITEKVRLTDTNGDNHPSLVSFFFFFFFSSFCSSLWMCFTWVRVLYNVEENMSYHPWLFHQKSQAWWPSFISPSRFFSIVKAKKKKNKKKMMLVFLLLTISVYYSCCYHYS